MKILLLMLLTFVVSVVGVVEVGLRSLFGFGNPLTYIADENIGYLLAPNQRTRRFGNAIEINEYSMRSAATTKTRSPDTLRVLLIGDSIVNGGWWTHQSQTISSLMQRDLAVGTTASIYRDIEVLNASANSWGPRNELAYVQKFGTFNSQAVVLVINTDDLFSTAPTSLPVGRDKNYPASKPPLALVEVYQRYLRKSQPIPELEVARAESGDRVAVNLEAIAQIHKIVRKNNGRFLLAMTPLQREIGVPGPRDYEIKARQRLIEFAQSRQIQYIDFLPIFNSQTQPKELYKDHIHLNMLGNQLVSTTITNYLQQNFDMWLRAPKRG